VHTKSELGSFKVIKNGTNGTMMDRIRVPIGVTYVPILYRFEENFQDLTRYWFHAYLHIFTYIWCPC